MKKIISLLLVTGMLFALCSCVMRNSSNPQTEEQNKSSDATHDSYAANITALKGPTGMGLSYLMSGNGHGNYNFRLSTAPDEVVSGFVSGNIDIAAIPINLASTLYNKLNGDVQMLAINTLGVLYILENGDTIHDIKDLSGKTIYATGQASTPEYILNYILEKNGLSDVKIEYCAEHSQLATLLTSGNVNIGMLPEPNVTATMVKNNNLRIAVDMTEEWKKISDTELAQGCIIARKSFIEKHKELIETFIEDFKASAAFVNENQDEASQMIADNEILPSAAIAKRAINNCNIVCITGDEMRKNADNMFKVLHSSEPKSIGGSIPGDDMYYIPNK